MPFRRNACPTLPAANVAPPCSVPLLPSMMSLATPSPGHQLTKPAAGAQALTVIVTGLLCTTEPKDAPDTNTDATICAVPEARPVMEGDVVAPAWSV